MFKINSLKFFKLYAPEGAAVGAPAPSPAPVPSPAPAPVAAPVDPSVPAASQPQPEPPAAPSSVPPVNGGTPAVYTKDSSGRTILPFGTHDEIVALRSRGNGEEQLAWLNKIPEEARPALRAALENQPGFEFIELDKDEPSVDPASQQNQIKKDDPASALLSEEEYNKADDKVKALHDLAVDLMEEIKNSPDVKKIESDFDVLKKDPKIAMRLKEIEGGKIEIKSTPLHFQDIFDPQKTVEALEPLLNDKNRRQEVYSSLNQMIEFAANAASEKAYKDGLAEGSRISQNEAKAYVESERNKSFMENEFNTLQKEIPEFSEGSFIKKNPDGTNAVDDKGRILVDHEHKMFPFFNWLVSMTENGTINANTIKALGMKAIYTQYQIKNAGSPEAFIASKMERARAANLSNYRYNVRRNMQSQQSSPVPASSGSTSGGNIHGVDIARASNDMAYQEALARSNQLSSQQLREVNEAIAKFRSGN